MTAVPARGLLMIGSGALLLIGVAMGIASQWWTWL